MDQVTINLYKAQWVLTSAETSPGEGHFDAPPVRLVSHEDRAALSRHLEELLREPVPVVPVPDFSDPAFTIGIRAQAVGAKSWRTFVNNSRCFVVRRQPAGLVLEEWPRVGGSFSANAEWSKAYKTSEVNNIAKHLGEMTHADVAQLSAKDRREAIQTPNPSARKPPRRPSDRRAKHT